MAFDDNHEDGVARRRALKCMVWVSIGTLWMVSGSLPNSTGLLIDIRAIGMNRDPGLASSMAEWKSCSACRSSHADLIGLNLNG
jgi:hypothetical protein